MFFFSNEQRLNFNLTLCFGCVFVTLTCRLILKIEVCIMPRSLTFSTAVFFTYTCTWIGKVPQFTVKSLEIETKDWSLLSHCHWSKISFIYTKRINSTGIRVHSDSHGRHIVLPTKPKKTASKSVQEKSKSLANSEEKNHSHAASILEYRTVHRKTISPRFSPQNRFAAFDRVGAHPSGSGF